MSEVRINLKIKTLIKKVSSKIALSLPIAQQLSNQSMKNLPSNERAYELNDIEIFQIAH
jgi:hypothetical protein